MALPTYDDLVGSSGPNLPSYDDLMGIPTLPPVVVSPRERDYAEEFGGTNIDEILRTPEAREQAEALTTVLKETARAQLEPQPLEEVAAGPILSPFVRRIKEAIAASEGGYTREEVQALISPEYDMFQRARHAKTPLEFYRAAVPLGLEAAQYAGAALPFLPKVFPKVIPRVPIEPPPVPRGPPPLPILATRPDPYAPPQPTENLAAAIARAQQTKVQRAVQTEGERQAGLPGEPPIQEPVEGQAPDVNAADAAAWQQDLMRQAAVLRRELAKMQRAGLGSPQPLADALHKIEDELRVGYQPPPERRFITQPPPEGGGTLDASQVTSPAGVGVQPEGGGMGAGTSFRQPRQAAPVRQGTTGPAPSPAPQQGTGPLPQAATATGEVGARHEALVQQFAPGVIERGVTRSPQEMIDAARARIGKVDPYQAASRVTRGEMVSPPELADLIVEHERLRQIAMERERIMNANQNPQTITDWHNALQASENFAVNVIKPAGTAWGEYGNTLQTVTPPDPMTITGARDIAISRLNRELMPKEANKIVSNTAKHNGDMTKADARTQNAMKKVGPGKTPSRAELGKVIDDIMKDLLPCDLP